MRKAAKNMLIATVAGVVACTIGGQVAARDAIYSKAGLEQALRHRIDRPPPAIDGRTVAALERTIQAERNRQKAAETARKLDEARERWKRTAAQVDRELRRSIRIAQKDATRRGWVVALNVISIAARIGADFAAKNAKGAAGSRDVTAETDTDAAEHAQDGIEAQRKPVLNDEGAVCFSAPGGCVAAPAIQTMGAKRRSATPPPSPDRMKLGEALGIAKIESPPTIEFTEEDRQVLAYIEETARSAKEMKWLTVVGGTLTLDPRNIANAWETLKNEGKVFDRFAAVAIYWRLEEHIYLENCSQSSCPIFRKLSDVLYDYLDE